MRQPLTFQSLLSPIQFLLSTLSKKFQTCLQTLQSVRKLLRLASSSLLIFHQIPQLLPRSEVRGILESWCLAASRSQELHFKSLVLLLGIPKANFSKYQSQCWLPLHIFWAYEQTQPLRAACWGSFKAKNPSLTIYCKNPIPSFQPSLSEVRAWSCSCLPSSCRFSSKSYRS